MTHFNVIVMEIPMYQDLTKIHKTLVFRWNKIQPYMIKKNSNLWEAWQMDIFPY